MKFGRITRELEIKKKNKMNVLHENYKGDISAKDGGFIFQAIVSHEVKWSIRNGKTQIDPSWVYCFLHQVDVFPDIKLSAGTASLTYVTLSEINLLKRKFELASEAIKKRVYPAYAEELLKFDKGTSSEDREKLDEKYFKNTYYEVVLKTNRLVLREVSTSSLDSGTPRITLKISTSMVDSLDGKPAPTWENFTIDIDGSANFRITNKDESISMIKEYDPIERTDDQVFGTILPSLILDFKGDAVSIDTYSNRSTVSALYVNTDYDNLFSIEDRSKYTSDKQLDKDK